MAPSGERRIRRLVLVNPARFGLVRLQRLGRLVSPAAVDLILPRLVARWIIARTHRLVYGDPTQITGRDEDEYWAPSQFPAYARAMRRLIHEFDWVRAPAREMAVRLETLRTPILVILGTRDRLVRGARDYVGALQANGARLTVEVVEGGGHAVNEECAKITVERVLSFFRDSIAPDSVLDCTNDS